MKDIDFDELDKAVNSLMATTPKPGQNAEEIPQSQIVNVAPTAETPVEPPSVSPIINAPEQSELTPSRPVAPAIRRSGRFMDMVSKPADQRPVRPAVVPTPSSREGLSITPREEDVTDDPTASSVDSAPVNESTVPITTTLDPIEFSQHMEAADSAPVESSTVPVSDSVIAQQLGSTESPFLSDAVVEKRPLNAGAQDMPPTDLASVISEDTEHYSAGSDRLAGDNDEDEPPFTPQVAELSSDVVAIESANGPGAIQAIETADALSEVEPPSAPLGAASIAQQYTKQPSTGDQSHAAIYDASQYPEPISHPAKSKSGWLWVLWVALLLGIGAGGAIVLYNLGIIP